jgi:hypothetical protein
MAKFPNSVLEWRNRRAFSTVELLVSLSVASVLTLGLSSAIIVAGRSLDVPAQPIEANSLVGNAVGRIKDALVEAKGIELSANSAVITVNDRDGDGFDDTITYRMDDGRLLEESDLSGKRVIAEDVSAMKISANQFVPSDEVDRQVWFEGVESKDTGAVSETQLDFPPGCVIGDFLVSIVAYEDDSGVIPIATAGWNLVDVQVGTKMTIAAWFKRKESEGENSVTISWTKNSDSIGCVMRLSGQSSSSPLMTWNRDAGRFDGSGTGPSAPALNVDSEGSLVLQAVMTKKTALSSGNSGLNGHVMCCSRQKGDSILAVSTRQIGSATGIVDSNNRYEFSRSANYVMLALAIGAEP